MGKKKAKKPAPAKEKQPPKTVFGSAAEVAGHFGVSERAVHYWLSAGCPGQPGEYDAAAIAAWRDGRKKDEQSDDNPRAKYLAARAERELLKLAKDRRELVEADAVRRLFARHIHEAKAILGQLADRASAAVPSAQAKIRKKVREETKRLVDDVCNSLADLLTAPEIRAAEET
jgi:uncharacterized protein YicC (UPF0701 family)